MTNLRLLGLDNIVSTIQVAQDGQTASRAFPGGYPPLLSGGNIAINVDRTSLQVAPDSVRMSVDLSGATFDAAGPAAGANYDPRYHDLVYLWDTGDTGAYQHGGRCPTAWVNKAQARGPWIAHCYETDGTYTASVTVIEPSSGKTASASVTFTVGDPTTVLTQFGINPVGSSATGWGPAGTTYVAMDGVSKNMHDQSWWATVRAAGDVALWLDPAQDYTANELSCLLLAANDPTSVLLGGYGGEAEVSDVKNTGVGTGDGRVVYTSASWRGDGSAEIPDLRITNLRMTGDFDPTAQMRRGPAVENFKNGTLLRGERAGDYIISNCHATGNKGTWLTLYCNTNNNTGWTYDTGAYDSQRQHTHVHECSCQNFGGEYGAGFWTIHDTMVDSTLAVTGFNYRQGPAATTPNGGGEWSGAWRENGHRAVYMAACDGYIRDDANKPWKFCSTLGDAFSEHIINVNGLIFEGGDVGVYICDNIKDSGKHNQSVDVNAVFDRIIGLCTSSNINMFNTYATGLTMRNVLGILPSQGCQSNDNLGYAPSNQNVTWSSFDPSLSGGTNYKTQQFAAMLQYWMLNSPPSVILDQPIRVYNCTFVADRLLDDNRSNPGSSTGQFRKVYQDVRGIAANTVIEQNNIWQGEWDGQTGAPSPDAPLSTDVLFTPLEKGFLGAKSVFVDLAPALATQLETPAGAVKASRPLSGSAAIGAATTGLVAYDDMLGAVRAGSADRGALTAGT